MFQPSAAATAAAAAATATAAAIIKWLGLAQLKILCWQSGKKKRDLVGLPVLQPLGGRKKKL